MVDAKKQCSPTGNRTRVAWVKTTYPDQLDYRGCKDCAPPGVVENDKMLKTQGEQKNFVIGVGFEPTPPKRPVP